MRQDVTEYLIEHHEQSIPSHAQDAHIQLLWIAFDRMRMFAQMADKADAQSEYDFMMALFHDYELIFYGALHAVEVSSDDIENYRQQLARHESNYNQGIIDFNQDAS